MTANYYPVQHHAPAEPVKKGLGITSLVLGIIALVLSFIPVLGLISILLGMVAVILGILAIVKRQGRGQGIAGTITGALGVVFALIVTLALSAFIVAVDEEIQRGETGDAWEAEIAEEQLEEEAAAAEAQEEEGEDPAPAAEPGEEGSRENPLSLGETVSHDNWEVTVYGVTPDADDQVAAENEFNDPSPEGSSYALVEVSATYLGEGSEIPVTDVDISYVTGTGETISTFDYLAIAPDDFNIGAELYNGGTERGNMALAIPDDDDEGTLRLRLGFIDTRDYFFETQ